MSKCRIAIIDDGAIGNIITAEKNLVVDKSLNICEDNDIAEKSGHAFVCLSIIKKYAQCNNLSWLNIKVIDPVSGRSSSDQFIKALEYCYENNVKVIHLSIGSEEFCDFDKINHIVKKMLDNNIIIVASQSNEGKLTYPAGIEGIIGVRYLDDVKDDDFVFVSQPVDNISFLASPSHILKNGGNMFVSKKANSYATPVMTAHVINELRRNPGISPFEIIDILKEKACKKIPGDMIPSDPFYRNNDIPIPVVGVFCKDAKKAGKITFELSDMFNKDGYGAVYSIPQANGMNRYRENKQKEYYSFLAFYSGCNIIVAGADAEVSDESYYGYDIIVTDEPSKYKGLSEKTIPLQDRCTSELYKLILKEFE